MNAKQKPNLMDDIDKELDANIVYAKGDIKDTNKYLEGLKNQPPNIYIEGIPGQINLFSAGMDNDIDPTFLQTVEPRYMPNITSITTKCYIGIDPGKSGGIVALGERGNLISKQQMPVLGDNLDISVIFDLFSALIRDHDVVVILEDVHSIFGMSAATNFTFGYVCGAIEAVVLCQRMKLVKVAPKTWQKELWINADKVFKPKKPEQKNPSVDTKATSLCAVTRLFPSADLRKSERSKLASDGIVDALLLAEYGRRKNL